MISYLQFYLFIYLSDYLFIYLFTLRILSSPRFRGIDINTVHPQKHTKRPQHIENAKTTHEQNCATRMLTKIIIIKGVHEVQ